MQKCSVPLAASRVRGTIFISSVEPATTTSISEFNKPLEAVSVMKFLPSYCLHPEGLCGYCTQTSASQGQDRETVSVQEAHPK